MMAGAAALDLDFDVVELAPYVPPPAAPLREVAFRRNAWLPAETETLRRMFGDDETLEAICAALGRSRAGVVDKICQLGLRRRTALPWSELDDEELCRRYGHEPAARIAQDLGRSVTSIYSRAGILDLQEENPPDWDPWEDEQLRVGYAQAIPLQHLAALIGRTLSAVATRANKLALRHPNHPDDWSGPEIARALALAEEGHRYSAIRERMAAEGFTQRSKSGFEQKIRKLGYHRGWGRFWTPEEDEVLRAAYEEGASLTPLRGRLGRTGHMIRWRAGYLGLQGTHEKKAGWRTEPSWSADEDAILRRDYHRVSPAELAKRMGRPKGGVYNRAWALGLETGRYRPMSADEDRAVRIAAARAFPIGAVARTLGRDVNVIKKRARFLGVAFITNPAHTHIARRAAKALGPMTLQDILALEAPAPQTLDQETLGVLLCSMSDASAAALLDRPARWVAAQRAQLQLKEAA